MHILLTVTHVLAIGNKGGKSGISMDAMPKPQKLTFPLASVSIFKAGDSDFAEIAYIFNMNTSWRCAELFEDVLKAMRNTDGGHLIRVPLTEKVEAAVAKAFPMPAGVTAGDHITRPNWGDVTPRSISDAVEGDLRIMANEGGFWIECLGECHGGYGWSRAGVPSELRGTYTKKEAAIQAARVAGYLRRLVDDAEDQG